MVAGFQVGVVGGEADCGCDGEEGGFVGWGREEVHEGGEEEAGSFFFGGEPEELGVEGEDLLFFFEAFGHEGGFEAELPEGQEDVVEELDSDAAAETDFGGAADGAAAVEEGGVAVSGCAGGCS